MNRSGGAEHSAEQPENSTEVSGSIDLHVSAQRFHPSGKFPVAITHGRRQECPARAIWIFSK